MTPQPKKPLTSDPHLWEQGWDGHRLEQALRLARLSLPEKLAWQEEAYRLVRQLAAANDTQAKSDR
jgi:hypothetical protein